MMTIKIKMEETKMTNPNIQYSSCGFPHDNPWNFESPRLQAWRVALDRLHKIISDLDSMITSTTPWGEVDVIEKRISAVYVAVDRIHESLRGREI